MPASVSNFSCLGQLHYCLSLPLLWFSLQTTWLGPCLLSSENEQLLAQLHVIQALTLLILRTAMAE